MSVSTSPRLQAALESPDSRSCLVRKAPRIGYVFSGQGGQWFAMGRELIDVCPAFTAALHRAQRCLHQLGAQWSLMDELTRIETETRVNEPTLSMALTTSLQLGLVELLRAWGIEPAAVTSHSSGEAAAAYAAGAIDFESAIAVSYYAGFLAQGYQEKLNIRGAMVAVGLGPAEALPYLDQLRSGRASVACINSPSSVTISGDVEAVAEVEERLTTDKIFVRRLKVSAAYHSHHMLPQADDYLALLSAKFGLTPGNFANVRYSSPVSGKTVWSAATLGPQNWVDNITRPVLFAQSLSNMFYGQAQVGDLEPQQLVDTIIEIGPHSSLAGPVRQVLNQAHVKVSGISYANCLEQNKNAISTMQSLVHTLLRQGYPVDMTKVNILSDQTMPPDLQDLPPNHSMSSLNELPPGRSYSFHQQASHDLLDSTTPHGNGFAPVRRHSITLSQLPWIRDHVLQSERVHPGAGFITMAIEAYEQTYCSNGDAKEVYHLENVVLEAALVIPDTFEGIEVQLRLHKRDKRFLDSNSWCEFAVDSVNPSGKLQHHCRGSITRQASVYHTSSVNVKQVMKESCNAVNLDRFYGSFEDIGIEYGPLCRNVSTLAFGDSMAKGEINVANTSTTMPSQSGSAHIVHPSTLDALFQAMYATLPNGGQELGVAMLPKKIESLVVRPYLRTDSGTRIRFAASRNRRNRQSFDASLVAFTDGDVPYVEVGNLHFRATASSFRNINGAQRPVICSTMYWREDLALIDPEHVMAMLRLSPDEAELRLIADVKRVSFHFIHDALATLSPTDIENLNWYHKTFYDWMLSQVELAKADQIAPRSSKWLKTSAGVKGMLIEKVAGASVSGKMVVRIGKNLLPILRKETSPMQLMLEGELLYAYYEKALRASRSFVQAERLVELIGHKIPHANILEIGGGTAGCTVPVLQALRAATNNANPGFQSYTFTDVAPGLFEMAQEKLAEWGSMITYRPLDVEQSPGKQGFVCGSYDIIVACQVLHATKSVANTMANLRSLLRPGGKLLMIETTQDALDVQFIFGTLPGWWSSDEAERKQSPSLSIDSWSRVLEQSGFSGLDFSVDDSQDPKTYSQSVLLSTALDNAVPVPLAPLIMVYTGQQPPEPWVQAITSEVESSFSSPLLLLPLSEAMSSATDKICLFVDDRERPLLSDIGRSDFDTLRDVLRVVKGALWLHYGGTMTTPLPAAGLVQGLLRVLRSENNTKRFVSLDMDSGAAPFALVSCRAIGAVLRATFDERQPRETIECEYAEKNGAVFIPRLYESVEESQAASGTDILNVKPEPRPFQDAERELVMDIGTPGALETLHFVERSIPDHLDSDLVEIAPKAFGLNSRDIMVAMGQLDSYEMGFECSGIVTGIGSAVTSVMPGDRVCALLQGEMATKSLVHESSVVKIPDSMSFDVAASIPVAYATAYHSLFTVGRLEQGESVLIHEASGGIGRAAVALANLTGATIYATAGSPEKREFVVQELGIPVDQIFSSRDMAFVQHIMAATHGRGVDVILNSLPDSLLQASWRCIAKFGRFIEIGNNDFELKHLDMKPFARAASFTAVDLVHLGQEKPHVVARAMCSIFDLLMSGSIQPVNPVTVLPISQIGRAFRIISQGKHMGKIVIKAEPGDLVPVIPQRPVAKLRSDATYVVTGGFGRIGRMVSKMLAARGAIYLLLLSRSAGKKTSDQDFVRELKEMGCHAIAHPCDIGSKDALNAATGALREHSMPPVRGVIQGAMVQEDCVFERMTYENWCAAVYPKVDGTVNLAEEFEDLDFFIMLSSLAGISGNSSQANYAAGCTFQDSFARWRASQDLPAVSIALGFVESAGNVADKDGVAKRLAQAGYRQLSERHVLNLVESAICNPKRSIGMSQVTAGIAAFDETQEDVSWRQEPRFSALRTLTTSDSHGDRQLQVANRRDGPLSKYSIQESLSRSDSWADGVDIVIAAITSKLSEMFMVPEADIDRSKPPSVYGVDSLLAVDLRNWLFAQLQAELSMFDVLQSESLAKLGELAAEKSKLVQQAGLAAGGRAF